MYRPQNDQHLTSFYVATLFHPHERDEWLLRHQHSFRGLTRPRLHFVMTGKEHIFAYIASLVVQVKPCDCGQIANLLFGNSIGKILCTADLRKRNDGEKLGHFKRKTVYFSREWVYFVLLRIPRTIVIYLLYVFSYKLFHSDMYHTIAIFFTKLIKLFQVSTHRPTRRLNFHHASSSDHLHKTNLTIRIQNDWNLLQTSRM